MKRLRAAAAVVLLLIVSVSCSPAGRPASETQEAPPSVPEPASQSETAEPNKDTLSDAIEEAIIGENQGKYLPGECYGVGYKVIETFEEDDIISVYALTEYVEYHFEDDVFANISGTNPNVLMRFQKTDDNYELIDYTRLDIFSGLSDEELEALMQPLEETGKEYFFTDQDLQEVRAQADSCAAEYLKSIGRTAEIGVRQDHEGQRLEELVSDRELLNQLFKDDELGRYPEWTGTTERIENGSRYVYQTDFDKDNQTILYTKLEYGSGEAVKITKVDVRQEIVVE